MGHDRLCYMGDEPILWAQAIGVGRGKLGLELAVVPWGSLKCDGVVTPASSYACQLYVEQQGQVGPDGTEHFMDNGRITACVRAQACHAKISTCSGDDVCDTLGWNHDKKTYPLTHCSEQVTTADNKRKFSYSFVASPASYKVDGCSPVYEVVNSLGQSNYYQYKAPFPISGIVSVLSHELVEVSMCLPSFQASDSPEPGTNCSGVVHTSALPNAGD